MARPQIFERRAGMAWPAGYARCAAAEMREALLQGDID